MKLSKNQQERSSSGSSTPQSTSSNSSSTPTNSTISSSLSTKSEVYVATNHLFDALTRIADPETHHIKEDSGHINAVLNSTLDMITRSKLELHHHQFETMMPQDIKEDMFTRAFDNNVTFPLHGKVRLNEVMPISMDGFVPFLSVNEQLRLLKAKEKYLMVEKWREIWEEVRPPRRRWYEDKSKGFHREARKALVMAGNVENQVLEMRTRGFLMDLYRDEYLSNVMY